MHEFGSKEVGHKNPLNLEMGISSIKPPSSKMRKEQINKMNSHTYIWEGKTHFEMLIQSISH